jgi:hypothetical protein
MESQLWSDVSCGLLTRSEHLEVLQAHVRVSLHFLSGGPCRAPDAGSGPLASLLRRHSPPGRASQALSRAQLLYRLLVSRPSKSVPAAISMLLVADQARPPPLGSLWDVTRATAAPTDSADAPSAGPLSHTANESTGRFRGVAGHPSQAGGRGRVDRGGVPACRSGAAPQRRVGAKPADFRALLRCPACYRSPGFGVDLWNLNWIFSAICPEKLLKKAAICDFYRLAICREK